MSSFLRRGAMTVHRAPALSPFLSDSELSLSQKHYLSPTSQWTSLKAKVSVIAPLKNSKQATLHFPWSGDPLLQH